jgi:hypothetical protein
MKPITDYFINNENNQIHESAGTITIAAAMFFFSVVTSASMAFARRYEYSSDDDPRSPWQIVKDDISGFFKDKKLKRIANKYKVDPEIVEFVNNPRKRGWRKMLETKLSPEEAQYINSLTRTYFE